MLPRSPADGPRPGARRARTTDVPAAASTIRRLSVRRTPAAVADLRPAPVVDAKVRIAEGEAQPAERSSQRDAQRSIHELGAESWPRDRPGVQLDVEGRGQPQAARQPHAQPGERRAPRPAVSVNPSRARSCPRPDTDRCDTCGAAPIVQPKAIDALAPARSCAVTETPNIPVRSGRPEIVPVTGFSDSPGGSPVACRRTAMPGESLVLRRSDTLARAVERFNPGLTIRSVPAHRLATIDAAFGVPRPLASSYPKAAANVPSLVPVKSLPPLRTSLKSFP